MYVCECTHADCIIVSTPLVLAKAVDAPCSIGELASVVFGKHDFLSLGSKKFDADFVLGYNSVCKGLQELGLPETLAAVTLFGYNRQVSCMTLIG